jgi:hypothetical protein
LKARHFPVGPSFFLSEESEYSEYSDYSGHLYGHLALANTLSRRVFTIP